MLPNPAPQRLCSLKRHQSFPRAQEHEASESERYADIPPNCQKTTKHKTVVSVVSVSPTLRCEEEVDDCHSPADSEDDIDFSPAPAHHTARDSFTEAIHSSPPSTCTDSADLQWTAKSSSYVYSLLEKETEYTCSPFALQLHQTHITPVMRAVLMDWMMEVCSEFTLKRETYYLAVNYVDRFLSLQYNVRKDEFQLVGLCAMFLAAKIEEVCNPKITDYSRAADNGFTLTQIKNTEKKLLKTLSWKIFPPTAFAWANVMMSLWDDYLACVCESMGLPTTHSDLSAEENFVVFKQANQHSYRRFRETMQILDVSYLDNSVLRYSSRHIVAGLLYLMISRYFYETDYALLATGEMKEETDSLACIFGDGKVEVSAEEGRRQMQARGAKTVQDLFVQFTRKSVEIHNIEDIYPTVAFLNNYVDFEVKFELPLACKLHPKAKLESHYEDFLAYQTHNSNNVPFVSQRLRCKK